MTPLERRGRRLLLIVLGLFTTDQVLTLAASVAGWSPRDWLKTVVQPVLLLGATYSVWQGEGWVRYLLGAALVFRGGLLVFVCGRVLVKLAAVTPPAATGFYVQSVGLPVGVVFALGLTHVGIGLVLLLAPSVRAFAGYQQRRAAGVWIEEV